MTDKEFKNLTRAQLIDIIYQLQLEMDKLTEKNQQLEQQLADKRLHIRNAGNLAEAALELNGCFRSAQNAAEQYLSEIRAMHAEMDQERERILAEARAEAQQLLANTKKTDAALEAILQEYGQSHTDNG